jgi:hypothetical protein
MKNNTLGKNLLIGLKGFIASIVTMLIVIIPVWLTKWLLISEQIYALAALLGLASIFLYFIVWGWLANKFWKWK